MTISLGFRLVDKDSSIAAERFPVSIIPPCYVYGSPTKIKTIFLSEKKKQMKKFDQSSTDESCLVTEFYRNIINKCRFPDHINRYLKETFFLFIVIQTSTMHSA